jgi:hypothetical protein
MVLFSVQGCLFIGAGQLPGCFNVEVDCGPGVESRIEGSGLAFSFSA